MSKIIKRKVALILPDGTSDSLLLFEPPEGRDRHIYKIFHFMSNDEMAACDVRIGDVLYFEPLSGNSYRFIGVSIPDRGGQVVAPEVSKKYIPMSNMVDAAVSGVQKPTTEDRLRQMRMALVGMQLNDARKLLNNMLCQVNSMAIIPAPEGSDTSDKKGADTGI